MAQATAGRAAAGTPEIDPEGFQMIVEAINEKGYVLQDFLKVTDDEAEALYARAYQLFEQEQFAKAEETFAYLCRLNHFVGKYWLGLGLCRQMRRNYEGAVRAYGTAGVHELENPVPALRAAECYMAMGKLDEAESGAQAALHWAGAKPEHQGLKARAQLLLEGVQRQKGGK